MTTAMNATTTIAIPGVILFMGAAFAVLQIGRDLLYDFLDYRTEWAVAVAAEIPVGWRFHAKILGGSALELATLVVLVWMMCATYAARW